MIMYLFLYIYMGFSAFMDMTVGWTRQGMTQAQVGIEPGSLQGVLPTWLAD